MMEDYHVLKPNSKFASNLLVIGAAKACTRALHEYLDKYSDILSFRQRSQFFFGTGTRTKVDRMPYFVQRGFKKFKFLFLKNLSEGIGFINHYLKQK